MDDRISGWRLRTTKVRGGKKERERKLMDADVLSRRSIPLHGGL